MNFSEIYKITLVLLLIACAVSVNLTRSLLRSVIIFMSYSSIMCLLWILMESPDLAITEAAVGAGISGYLFLVTLKKLRQIDSMEDVRQHDGGVQEARQREGGAWTESDPEMDAAQTSDFPEGGVSQMSAFPDGGMSQTSAFPDSGAASQASGANSGDGNRKRRRGKGGGTRKEGGT